MNALVMQGDTPLYELAADEITFKFTPGRSGVPMYVVMRPYTADQLHKSMSGSRTEAIQRRPNVAAVDNSDLPAFQGLFDQLFIRLENVSGKDGQPLTREQQLAWLNANPGLKEDVITWGFTGVGIGRVGQESVEEESPEDAVFIIDLGGSEGQRVDVNFMLADSGLKIQHVIQSTHVFGNTSGEQRRQHRRAVTREFHRQTRSTRIVTNYKALSSLYDQLIISAEGYLLNGEPCTSANKSEWVNRIPDWHKQVAINELFDDSNLKNA